jgi:hypothetical protein
LEVVLVKNLKQLVIAVLAALMIAGALSAVSDAASLTSISPAVVVGEGSSPFPVLLSANSSSDATSLSNQF